MSENKKRISIYEIWIIVSLCFISIITACLASFVYFNKFDKENFNVSGFVIPSFVDTKNAFEIMPLNSGAGSSKQRDEFRRQLIKEYIVNRYTVNGSTFIMEQNLGFQSLNNPVDKNGSLLKNPGFIGFERDGTPVWRNAYTNFVNGNDGELAEINALLKEGTTRSVRILTEPVKSRDWWITKVEFIYKTPTTLSLSDARKELYQIAISSKLIGIDTARFNGKDASSIFGFNVDYIQKTRL